MRPLAIALALALAPPVASALDAFPAEARFGALEARVLVRLPEGGALRVDAVPPVDAAVVTPGSAPDAFSRTPATFDVAPGAPEASWHGLPGVVEVVVRRDSARDRVELELDDGAAGAVYEWGAQKRLPHIGAAGALVALIAGLAWPRRRTRAGAPRRE